MSSGNKILIGIPPRSHVLLANDEVEGLMREGFECETITYGRNSNDAHTFNRVFFTLGRAVQLYKKLRSFKPDFLYLNSRFESVGSSRDFLSLLIVKNFYRRNLKIIIKSHGSNLRFLKSKSYWFKHMVIPFLKKKVDAWIFLSTDEKEMIAEMDPALGNKIHILPNIVKPERAVYSEAFKEYNNLNDKAFTLMYAGRIVLEKGVFDIINALPLLKCKDKCKLILIGDGTDYEELKRTAQKLNLNGQVEFKGFMPENECDQFYANTDVLIYPTYDSEGFPMAIFKSVACGMPVVTTRIRAAKDYLKDPENTLWIKAKSPEDIAAAIDQLYDDPELTRQMKMNNAILGKNFSSEIVSAKMKELFYFLTNRYEQEKNSNRYSA